MGTRGVVSPVLPPLFLAYHHHPMLNSRRTVAVIQPAYNQVVAYNRVAAVCVWTSQADTTRHCHGMHMIAIDNC